MARQALVPGGAYVNETGTFEALAPGFGYLNETVATAATAALLGLSATVSAGILTPVVSQPLTGAQTQVSSGIVAPKVSVPLNGFSISTAGGTLSAVAAGGANLSGFAVTTNSGTPTPAVAANLNGFGVSTSRGTLNGTIPLLSVRWAEFEVPDISGATLSSSAITAASGTPSVAVSVALSGHSVSASAGTLNGTIPLLSVRWAEFEVPDSGTSADLTGQSLTISAGTLGAPVPLTGQSLSVSAGTITGDVAAAPRVQDQVTRLGQFGVGLTKYSSVEKTPTILQPITGHSAQTAAGSLDEAIAANLVGHSTRADPGAVGISSNPPSMNGLEGKQVAVVSGSVTVALTQPIGGYSASVSAGTLSVSISPALIGHAVTAVTGDIAVIGASLEGKSVTVSAGTLTASSTEIAPVVTPPLVGGGYNPAQGLYERKRTRKEISEARKKYGLDDRYKGEEIIETILEVAKDQAQSLQTEPAKQSKELSTALKIRGIEFDAIYLEALAAERQALIDAEIAIRLQQIEQEEEMLLLMMIAAAACE